MLFDLVGSLCALLNKVSVPLFYCKTEEKGIEQLGSLKLLGGEPEDRGGF